MKQNDGNTDLTPQMRAKMLFAAELIVAEGKTNEAAANQMGVSRSTVDRWIANPAWPEIVKEIVDSRVTQRLVLVAWECLEREASGTGRNAVAAAKEILSRLDRPVPVEISGPGGNPIIINVPVITDEAGKT